jgi:hypothetical protein
MLFSAVLSVFPITSMRSTISREPKSPGQGPHHGFINYIDTKNMSSLPPPYTSQGLFEAFQLIKPESSVNI